MIITVANTKGGTSKTTSTAFLLHALWAAGYNAVALDADPQGSLRRWADYGSWALKVEPWHPARPAHLASHGWWTVIDTPPTDDALGLVQAAVKVSNVVLMPVAPTSMEYERTHALHALVREHAPETVAAALMVRAVTGAVSTAFYRRALSEDGWRVLRTTVGRRESFAQAFGQPIIRAEAGPYGDVVAELTDIPDSRQADVPTFRVEEAAR
jgi:chromosome partitioning protein